MTVLGWWEQLPEEDQPPQRYWGDDDALKEWFDAVKQRRENRYSSEPMEEVPQVENEYARELIRAARG